MEAWLRRLRRAAGGAVAGIGEGARGAAAAAERVGFEDDLGRREAFREQIRNLENEIRVAGYEFVGQTNAYLHRTLAQLVRDLGVFSRSRAILDVQARLAEARTVQSKTIDAHRADWGEAIAAIKGSDGKTASTLYELLQLTPQLGLVPIGMDRDSKLWEFVHLASGTPGKRFQRVIPRRHASCQLPTWASCSRCCPAARCRTYLPTRTARR